MIPMGEVERLLDATRDAVALGSDGHPSEGAAILSGGYDRGRRLADEGLPWGHTLAELYALALASYAESQPTARV